MGEYISRETVLKELGKNSITKRITLADGVSIYDTIHNIPTADVAEVVRCEKCTRRVDYEGRIMCNKFGHKFQGEWYGLNATTKDHFCGYGERRTDNDV